jgi:hypothetical protein
LQKLLPGNWGDKGYHPSAKNVEFLVYFSAQLDNWNLDIERN